VVNHCLLVDKAPRNEGAPVALASVVLMVVRPSWLHTPPREKSIPALGGKSQAAVNWPGEVTCPGVPVEAPVALMEMSAFCVNLANELFNITPVVIMYAPMAQMSRCAR
jgi:hypothetical protein